MIIDCGTCEVRDLACGDCVVTVLLGAPPVGVELDASERDAIEALAGSGMVPPLRLVPSSSPAGPSHYGAQAARDANGDRGVRRPEPAAQPGARAVGQ